LLVSHIFALIASRESPTSPAPHRQSLRSRSFHAAAVEDAVDESDAVDETYSDDWMVKLEKVKSNRAKMEEKWKDVKERREKEEAERKQAREEQQKVQANKIAQQKERLGIANENKNRLAQESEAAKKIAQLKEQLGTDRLAQEKEAAKKIVQQQEQLANQNKKAQENHQATIAKVMQGRSQRGAKSRAEEEEEEERKRGKPSKIGAAVAEAMRKRQEASKSAQK
jgi:hypothetical protein